MYAASNHPTGWALAGLVAALLLPLTACSAGEATTPDTTATAPTTTVHRATADELGPLADALVANHRSGGAAFTAEVPYGTARIHFDGEVDWTNGRGRAEVTAEVDGGADTTATRSSTFEVRFAGDSVARTERELAEVVGIPGALWLAHTVDPETAGPLDRVLLLVAKLAAPTRENTSLLAQDGVDLLDPVEVTTPEGPVTATGYRRGELTYWLDEAGRLRRVDANLTSTRSTVTITLSDFGPKEVPAPEPPVIDEAKLSEEQRAALGDPG